MLAKLRLFGLVAAAMTAGSALATAAPATAGTAAAVNGFAASAYGTQVTVGPVVKSGRSALATLGCTSQTGVTHTNTAASVSAPPALTSGTIETRAASLATTTGVASTASSDVQSVSVLAGLVAATEVKSVSTTRENTSTGKLSVSAAGTEFTGLTVAGHSITGTPKPNTKITLPGVGYVILNQQVSKAASHAASLTVIAIHVVVTKTTSSAVKGTQVVVSFATSKLGGPVAGLLSGLAYGANAHAGTTVIAGKLFPESLGCLGTNGKTRTNSAASATIPGILTSGTVTDTAEGVAASTAVSGRTTSTVQGLNLLSGDVKATAVKADVAASGSPPALTDQSSFLGLSVAGHPGIGDHVPPNTKLHLAGIGTLWLHRVFRTPDSITVIMVQLDVTVQGNPFGLKPGTTVNVAYARVGIK